MSPPKMKFLKRSADDQASSSNENGSQPKAKRKRTQDPTSGGDSPVKSATTSTRADGIPSIADIDRVVDSLMEQVSKLKDYQPPQQEPGRPTSSSSPKDGSILPNEILLFASRGMLQLRGWQRQILDRYSSWQVSTQKQSEQCQRRDRNWKTLQYEKSHLEQEIASIQNFTMPCMDKVLQQESSECEAMVEDEETTKSPADRLASLDPNNAEHRTAILQHLRHQVQQRSELEQKRDQLREKLSAMKRESQKQQDVLKRQLPKQLNNLEQASKPLQQWFALPTIGSERTERLQMAQQLPPPLYTLFISLQENLDLVGVHAQQKERAQKFPEAMDVDPSTPPMGLRIVPTIGASASYLDKSKQSSSSQAHELQWTLPVPDISATGASFQSHQQNAVATSSTSRKQGRTVTIHFQCSADSSVAGSRCIRATVSGCPSGLDQNLLLSNLFPHEDMLEAEAADSNGSKRQQYYGWCHYLAGIHLTPPEAASAVKGKAPTAATTRAIVQTLQRRIRANATLKYILQSLQQHKKLPNLPRADWDKKETSASDGKSPAATSWQLVMFAQLPQADKLSSRFSFDVHCKSKASPRLEIRAIVEIDKARYPAVPPRWTLTSSAASEASRQQQNSSNPPLHNAAWKLMEKTLNQDLLLTLPTETGTSTPKTGDAKGGALTVEESENCLLFSEWILVSQFHKLLNEWEQVAAAGAKSQSSVTNGARSIRGRDRVPTNLSSRN